MNTAAQQHNALDVFAARAVTSARLWSIGGIDLLDAVDDLAAEAQRAGLDTDMAQEVMHQAFWPLRKAAQMTDDKDFEYDVLYQPEREDAEARKGKRARAGNGEQARAKTKHTAGGWKYHNGVSAIVLRWTIKGILPEIGAGVMAGQWGTYKTTMALEVSVCVMAGLLFAGRYRIERRGAVIYFALEGEGMIDARLSAIANHHGVEGPLPFAWRGDCPRLTDKNAAAQLCAMIDAAAADLKRNFDLDVALIWIDTVIAAAGYEEKGDDSDSAITQKVVNTFKAVAKHAKAMVIGIDHFGKVVETGTRGSSAKEGGPETVLALLGERELAGSVKNTRLALRKQRDGISGFEIPFTATTVQTGTDEDGDPITALVIDWQAEAASPTKKDQRWAKSLKLLRRILMSALVDQGKEVRPFPDGPAVRACNINVVRNEFYKQQPADGTEKQKNDARRQAFNRAFKSAQDNDLIASREVDGVQLIWLCQPEDPNKKE